MDPAKKLARQLVALTLAWLHDSQPMGAVLEDDVDDGQSFAVGHFGSRPIQRLADVLREKDEAALRERLHKEFGIEESRIPSVSTVFASF